MRPLFSQAVLVVFGGVLLAAIPSSAQAASPCEPITLDRLPLLPRDVTLHQFSSHNKRGLNGDAGWFLYRDDRGDAVVFDAAGPGCVRSFWQTDLSEDQVLKFYFDGETEPRHTISCLDLYRGKHPLFPAPLASFEKLGYWGDNPNAGNCFVPIPFAKSLKITMQGRVKFYHFLYERYPHGTPVTTFTGKEDRTILLRAFAEQGEDLLPPSDAEVTRSEFPAIEPGKSVELFHTGKAGTIARVVIEGDASEEFLRRAELEMRWDESPYPDVVAPVGMFFGPAVRPEAVRAMPVKVELLPENRMRLTSCFRMPFWRSARIALVNRSRGSAGPLGPIRAEIHVTPPRFDENEAGYFRTLYREGRTEMGRDWLLYRAAGTGRLLGVVQTMDGAHYCEGDEHFAIDGAGSPQINGTGSEDYYLACFWPNRNFNFPFAGCVGDVKLRPGAACYYRFHLEATVPFYGEIDARIQHGGRSDIVSEYRSLAFAYLRRKPALRETDLLDVANPTSERMHDYRATRSTLTEETAASHEGSDTETVVRDRGRRHEGGEITFTVAIEPGNAGMRLRRRLDQNVGRQSAEVYVDGEYAGTWYHADHNPHLRWFDSDHDVPATLTRGKSELKVRLVPREGDGHGPWTDFRYQAFVFADTTDRGLVVKTGVGRE